MLCSSLLNYSSSRLRTHHLFPMALTSSSLLLLDHHNHSSVAHLLHPSLNHARARPLISHSHTWPLVRTRRRTSCPAIIQHRPRHSMPLVQTRRSIGCSAITEAAQVEVGKEKNIVIVGAGIAGLATAVSLQRLGIRSLVIEQADSLRTSGTSLTLFKNGWRVLDAIGVGSDLRSKFVDIEGMVIKTEDGRELRSFRFKDEDASQEVRAVERRILLETLASQLPPEAIRFSSGLSKIESGENGLTLLRLDDGTRLQAKIVIGCDGVRSPVAKWLGFPEPKYVGHCAFRGLGYYSDGHPFEARVNYVYGRGLRAGYVPVSRTKVYWFICFNNSSPGPKITDPSLLKKQAQELVKNWPSELLNLIDRTPDDTISKTPLLDRWLWPAIYPPPSKDKVVLVGDAWHPMTPNLGQGGCCALEDAVVLARKLADTLNSESASASVEDALQSYGSTRWPRVFPLTIRAHLVGALLQWEDPIVCSLRNNIIIPKLVRLGPILEHTNFECEPLLQTN